MPLSSYIEYGIGTLFFRSKGYDHGLLINQPTLKSSPNNIIVTSDLGLSGSSVRIEHTQFPTEAGRRNVFPSLSWTVLADIESQIKEFVLCVEDADIPIPPSIVHAVHGLYYAIPASKRSISQDDFGMVDGKLKSGPESTKKAQESIILPGGFQLGKNLRGTVYGGPRPVMGHGPHRYFYQVIALKEKMDESKMGKVATLDEVKREMEGKVLGYGSWVGVWENKWK